MKKTYVADKISSEDHRRILCQLEEELHEAMLYTSRLDARVVGQKERLH